MQMQMLPMPMQFAAAPAKPIRMPYFYAHVSKRTDEWQFSLFGCCCDCGFCALLPSCS